MNAKSVLNVKGSLEGKKSPVVNVEGVASCPFCGTKNLPVLQGEDQGGDLDSSYLALHSGCKDKKRKPSDFLKKGDRVNLFLRNALEGGVFVIRQIEYCDERYIGIRLDRDGDATGQPLGFRYDFPTQRWHQQHISSNGPRCVHKNSKRRPYTIQKIHQK